MFVAILRAMKIRQKSKIAFISSQFPIYDETFILREFSYLAHAGLEYIIFSIKKPHDTIMQPQAKALLARTRYLPLVSVKGCMAFISLMFTQPIRLSTTVGTLLVGMFKSPDFFFKTLVLLPQAALFLRMMQREGITHLHGGWATHPTTVAWFCSRMSGIPYSFTGHAHDIYVNTVFLSRKMEDATFITTCTADNIRQLRSVCADNTALAEATIVNHHGVELERFIRHDVVGSAVPLRIISVGSLFPSKGFDLLLRACKMLKDRGTAMTCVIAGGGYLQPELEALRHELGLDTEVTFTGYITQDELLPYYLSVDVFALPVRLKIHWGIPNVCIEAAAAYMPILTCALPSITELFTDGEGGIIIPQENPTVLAEHLQRFADDRDLCRTMGMVGRARVERDFDLEKNAVNLMELFGQQAL